MTEPAVSSPAAHGSAGFVPRRIDGPVLAGVMPGQPLTVLNRAAELALTLRVKLICAYVDVTTFLAEDLTDGSSPAASSAGIDDDVERTSAVLRQRLFSALAGSETRWSFITLSGEPARALAHLAESADASFIVVGTREPSLGIRLEHMLVGSIAVRLTHDQLRPVVVIPLARE